MFWFKSKKTVIDAFTSRQVVYQQYPLARASKFVPEWWKQLPPTYPREGFPFVPEATAKYCQGFLDLQTKGFILPMWSDLAVELSDIDGVKNWKYQFADQSSLIQHHDYRSIQGMMDPAHYLHCKLIAPWVLKSKQDTKFVMTQPVWHQGDNIGKFTVLPGIIDFKYQHSINVNTFFEYIPGTVRQVMLETATPLVHMIPLTEDDVEIRCHEVSTDEYNRMNHNITKFKGSYRDRKVQLNTNEPSKCPFKLWH